METLAEYFERTKDDKQRSLRRLGHRMKGGRAMTDLYLSYSEYRDGGGIVEGQENDSWPSYEDTHISWHPNSLFLDESDVPTYIKETIPVDFDVERGDVVHIVVVRYGTGDTFSHTNGAWQIMGVSKDAKVAAQLAKVINDDTYTGDEEGAGSSYYSGYAPWRGYFERLEGADVHTFVVI